MSDVISCPDCKGRRYHIKSGHKRVVKPEKDDWAEYDGYNIRYVLCKKCNGKGYIIKKEQVCKDEEKENR